VVQILVVCCLAGLVGKAAMLQILEGPSWKERARAQVETEVQVPVYRGTIYDRHGRPMALSVPQHSLFADGAFVENPHKTAQQLAPILEEPATLLQKKLARPNRFTWLKRELSDQQANDVAEKNLPGISFVSEYKRFYPYRQIAGQVLGFVGCDGRGLEGIEKAYDEVLREQFHLAGQQRDGLKKRLALQAQNTPGPEERPGLGLTLDVFLQYLAERELEEAVKKYQARAGEVVIMDPQRFEICAIANWPPFNPNTYRAESADTWRNRAITDLFEPGSTFKVFLVAASLEEGSIRLQDRIFCEQGKYKLASHTINDVHPYGWLTIPELIKYSSNIGATKLALQLGEERFYRYIRAFGFGERTGIDLPGEGRGAVRFWKKWRPVELATAGFGQGIGVTSLQLTVGVACIANGGVWMQPTLVRGYLGPGGEITTNPTLRTSYPVIRKKTAQHIRDMMVEVTRAGGTGVQAAVPGYTAAGKTGTAQMLDPGSHRYSSSKYTSIYTGFIPAENPQLAMTVVIHEPRGAIYGGVVAAPVFHDIAAQALPYLGVAPTDPAVLPAVPPGTAPRTLPAQAHVVLATADSDSNSAPGVMPNVVGLSLKAALEELKAQELKLRMRGSGLVVKQSPAPGTAVARGDQAELLLEGTPIQGQAGK
jgi:cell division protein FtsI (penicillin-binding protein 3)